MPQFTDKEMEETKRIFKIFDKNGDGSITRDELGSVLRGLGQNPTNAQINELIESLDSNGNGKIEFKEFIKCMNQRGLNSEKEEEEEILAAFRVLDRDHNGYITAQELRHTMTSLGERMPAEEADAMIKEADTNGDGHINYKEFVALLTRKH